MKRIDVLLRRAQRLSPPRCLEQTVNAVPHHKDTTIAQQWAPNKTVTKALRIKGESKANQTGPKIATTSKNLRFSRKSVKMKKGYKKLQTLNNPKN